jgi:hypothetical protein
MKVKSLVDQAIFLSVQDAEFQPDIEQTYASFAVNEINNLLDEWRDQIPYSNEITFTNVSNLNSTTFSEVDTVQYVIISSGTNNAAFYLRPVQESLFKQQQQIIGLKSFPTIYYFDQLIQKINVYPAPTQNDYNFIVRGRVLNVDLGLFDDIPANLPRFMTNAIIYEVAFRLAARFGNVWSDSKENTRQGLLNGLLNKKSIDLTPLNECVFGLPSMKNNAPFPTWFYISGGGN